MSSTNNHHLRTNSDTPFCILDGEIFILQSLTTTTTSTVTKTSGSTFTGWNAQTRPEYEVELDIVDSSGRLAEIIAGEYDIPTESIGRVIAVMEETVCIFEECQLIASQEISSEGIVFEDIVLFPENMATVSIYRP